MDAAMSSERPEVSRPGRYAMVFSVLALLSLIWPIYSWFGRIQPMILGLPLSLFYIVTVIVTVFLVMLTLFLWEGKNNHLG